MNEGVITRHKFKEFGKFPETEKELETLRSAGETNTTVCCSGVDRDDFNTYVESFVSDNDDMIDFARYLRVLADYVEYSDEDIRKVSIHWSGLE